MPGGRPLKFRSATKLQKKIDQYFDDCDDTGEAYTITGLALALDTYRSTLMNYEVKPEFMNTIKRAKQRCEHYVEQQLAAGKLSANGIFLLKNYGWHDKQQVEVNDVTASSEDQLRAKLEQLLDKS